MQPGHRHQLHHWLQHEYPFTEWPFRRPGALGLRSFHGREFSDDHRWRPAGGPQGTQVSAVGGNGRDYSVARLHGPAIPQDGTPARGFAEPGSVYGYGGPEDHTHLAPVA